MDPDFFSAGTAARAEGSRYFPGNISQQAQKNRDGSKIRNLRGVLLRNSQKLKGNAYFATATGILSILDTQEIYSKPWAGPE